MEQVAERLERTEMLSVRSLLRLLTGYPQPVLMSTGHTPRADSQWHLPAQTPAWLTDRPHAGKPVRWVWTTLTELERAGHHPGVLGALRAVLLDHQPLTRAGRCRACRRLSWRHLWRRRSFPCGVWTTTHFALQGLFSGNTPAG